MEENATEMSTKEEVLDELGFAVPEKLEKLFAKYSVDEKSRSKRVKAQWDSMIKSKGWNITENPFTGNLPSRKITTTSTAKQHFFVICLFLFYFIY